MGKPSELRTEVGGFLSKTLAFGIGSGHTSRCWRFRSRSLLVVLGIGARLWPKLVGIFEFCQLCGWALNIIREQSDAWHLSVKWFSKCSLQIWPFFAGGCWRQSLASQSFSKRSSCQGRLKTRNMDSTFNNNTYTDITLIRTFNYITIVSMHFIVIVSWLINESRQ